MGVDGFLRLLPLMVNPPRWCGKDCWQAWVLNSNQKFVRKWSLDGRENRIVNGPNGPLKKRGRCAEVGGMGTVCGRFGCSATRGHAECFIAYVACCHFVKLDRCWTVRSTYFHTLHILQYDCERFALSLKRLLRHDIGRFFLAQPKLRNLPWIQKVTWTVASLTHARWLSRWFQVLYGWFFQ